MRWSTVKTWQLCVFLLIYVWDLIAAGLKISLDVITLKDLSHPGIVEVPIEKMSDTELAIVANLITFSPGSVVVDVSENRSVLYIHCMFADDPAEIIDEIKNRIEKRVLGLLR